MLNKPEKSQSIEKDSKIKSWLIEAFKKFQSEQDNEDIIKLMKSNKKYIEEKNECPPTTLKSY